MTSELQEVQAAGAKLIVDAAAAHERGEMGDALAIGFRLCTVMHCMVLGAQPAARKIVEEYCDQVGIKFDVLDEQVEARIYEHVQLARLEAGL